MQARNNTPLRIVFDLDGTLIDSAPDIREIANAILGAEGARPLDMDETRSFIGRGAAVFVARMMHARGLPESRRDAILGDFLARYETAVDLTRPYPGVPGTLETLASAGHALGLCTNKPEKPVHAVLRHLGLERFFPVIIGGNTLPLAKPHAAPLVTALASMGNGPALYIGDSEIDALTAEAAGVPFLLFTKGYLQTAPEDLVHAARFDDWTEVPGLLHHARG